MIEEQGESFQQDVKTIEKIPGMPEYQHVGRLLLVPSKRLLAVATPKKHRKDNFWISNHAIFSVMKSIRYTLTEVLCLFNLCMFSMLHIVLHKLIYKSQLLQDITSV